MKRLVFIATASLVVVLCAGCPPRADNRAAPTPPDALPSVGGERVDATWPFWPTSMRFHPLTMFSRDPKTDEPVIEARLEFFDDFGHVVKCVAQARFELHDHDPGDSADEPARFWNVDLRDLPENALHYDMVTLTYFFRLGLENELHEDEWHMRALVLSVDGRKFAATKRLR